MVLKRFYIYITKLLELKKIDLTEAKLWLFYFGLVS